MDTTLQDRRINWFHIILYGACAELVGIIGNIIYVYLVGEPTSDTNPHSFTQEYMQRTGIFIFMVLGFISYFGTAFWIAKRNRARTLYNGFRLVLIGAIIELLFFWIIGLQWKLPYAFSFLTYLVAVAFAGVNPFLLKGKQKHAKDWDAHKDKNYHQQTRK